MDLAIVLIILGGMLFYGHFLEKLSEKTSIPDILGLVLLGVLIGPVMNWVNPESFGIYGNLLSTLVLVLILFNSGASLKFQDLKKYIGSSMGLVYAGYLITWLIVAVLCYYLFDMTFVSALYIGSILGGTSAAVVIVFIKNIQLTEKTNTTLIIESAKTDIFTFIFPYTLLGVMTTGEFSAGKVGIEFIMTFAISIAIGFLAAFLWSIIVNKIPFIKNTQFATPAYLLIIYGFTQYIEFSGPLMALIFGIVLGNINVFEKNSWIDRFVPTQENLVTKSEKDFVGEIIFMLKIYFFIFVGLSIKVDDMNLFLWGGVITLIIFLVRIFIVKFVISKDTPLFDKAVISTMAPKGLATAVMGSLPLQQGYVDGEIIQSLLYSGLILSILVTVILFFLLDKKITLPFYKIIYGENSK